MQNISRNLIEYNNSSTRIQNKCILVEHVKEKLSELVSRRIRELKLSKAEVARQTDLSRSYIGNMANGTAPTPSGEYEPSPDSIVKLAKTLKVSQSEILEAMNYLPENGSETNNSHDVLEGVTITFQNGKGLSKKQQQDILDAARLIARGVQANGEKE